MSSPNTTTSISTAHIFIPFADSLPNGDPTLDNDPSHLLAPLAPLCRVLKTLALLPHVDTLQNKQIIRLPNYTQNRIDLNAIESVRGTIQSAKIQAETKQDQNQHQFDNFQTTGQLLTNYVSQHQLFVSPTLSPVTNTSSWLYSDVPVNIFAQLERSYEPYDVMVKSAALSQSQRLNTNKCELTVTTDIPLQFPLNSTSVLPSPGHNSLHSSKNQSSNVSRDGDVVFEQLFKQEHLISSLLSLLENHSFDKQINSSQNQLIDINDHENNDLDPESTTSITSALEKINSQQYLTKLHALRTHLQNQTKYLKRSLQFNPFHSSRSPQDDNNNVNHEKEDTEQDNNEHKFSNYLHHLFHNNATSHLSLQLFNQLQTLNHVLSPSHTFPSTSIPISTLASPNIQFFYKESTVQSTTSQPNQQQQQQSSSFSLANSTTIYPTTPIVTKVIHQVPSSASAAFQIIPGHTSSHFSRIDNQLRFFGYTFSYQFVTYGFHFQLSKTLEVRIYKLCQVISTKQPSSNPLSDQFTSMTDESKNKFNRGRKPSSTTPPTSIPSQPLVPLSSTYSSAPDQAGNDFLSTISSSTAQHYNKTLSPPSSELAPFLSIIPVPNAQWICEIRALHINQTKERARQEIESVMELIQQQIYLHHRITSSKKL